MGRPVVSARPVVYRPGAGKARGPGARPDAHHAGRSSRPRQRTARCPDPRFNSTPGFTGKPEYPIPAFSWAILVTPLRQWAARSGHIRMQVGRSAWHRGLYRAVLTAGPKG